MFLKCTGKALAIFGVLLASGCSSSGGMSNFFPSVGDNTIKIESDPSGAEVYVMGERIGVTPIQIHHQDVFPNIYPNEKLSVYGRITLKKAGCADFTRTVSSEISSNGLRAKLDCGDTNPTPSATSSHLLSPQSTSGDAPRSHETVEQRLDKIKELLSKGLITEEEARKVRERILNDL